MSRSKLIILALSFMLISYSCWRIFINANFTYASFKKLFISFENLTEEERSFLSKTTRSLYFNNFLGIDNQVSTASLNNALKDPHIGPFASENLFYLKGKISRGDTKYCSYIKIPHFKILSKSDMYQLSDKLLDKSLKRTLIFDLRECSGGDLRFAKLLLSQILNFYYDPSYIDPILPPISKIRTRPVQLQNEQLNSLSVLSNYAELENIVTSKDIELQATQIKINNDRLIYILTNDNTASACEHFALSLKKLNFNTFIVGDTKTAGAIRYGSVIYVKNQNSNTYWGIPRTIYYLEEDFEKHIDGIIPDINFKQVQTRKDYNDCLIKDD